MVKDGAHVKVTRTKKSDVCVTCVCVCVCVCVNKVFDSE